MRKFFLGPALRAKCKQCGNKVGVPYSKALVAMVPLFLGLTLDGIFGSLILILVGFIITSVIYVKWVPLIKR